MNFVGLMVACTTVIVALKLLSRARLQTSGFPDLDVDIAFYFLDTRTGLRC